MQTGIGIRWCGDAWIDEGRKSLVLAGSEMSLIDRRPRPCRVIDMETGQIQEGTGAVLTRALSRTESDVVYAALALAAERETPEARADLLRIFSQNDAPTVLRVKAAVALARLGDRRGQDLVKRTAFGGARPESDHALIDLPVVIGDEAGPLICEFAQRPQGSFEAIRAAMYVVKSATAVPALTDLLKKGPDSARVCLALECLGDRGRDAVPAFDEVAKLLDVDRNGAEPTRTQKFAARVLGRMGSGAERALPMLTRLAERYAPTLWIPARISQPVPRMNYRGESIYSKDEFVNAICRIRQKWYAR